ncbi:MAG: hypothetical protein KGH65_05645 [Candidatus Micrarchaeota archaeon]|nr:hypothetical protein [Candidatus Micrarchaeota archaeon]
MLASREPQGSRERLHVLTPHCVAKDPLTEHSGRSTVQIPPIVSLSMFKLGMADRDHFANIVTAHAIGSALVQAHHGEYEARIAQDAAQALEQAAEIGETTGKWTLPQVEPVAEYLEMLDWLLSVTTQEQLDAAKAKVGL